MDSRGLFLFTYKVLTSVLWRRLCFIYLLLCSVYCYHCSHFNILLIQRLEHEARIWEYLEHPNVSEFFGLAFNVGSMPALILPFYGNGTVVQYVKEKDDQARLDMVFAFHSLDSDSSDKHYIGETNRSWVRLSARTICSTW